MNRCCSFFRSSIGRKFLVGFTGLMLAGFCLMHMAANTVLLINPETYNRYSHGLTSNPAVLYGGELFLLVMLLVHVFYAAKLTLENRGARGSVPGPRASSSDKQARFGSRSMILTGLLILVFLILHLNTFKYGTYYSVTYNSPHGSEEMRDLGRLVIEKFQDPTYVAFYIFSLILLGIHLSHGLAGLLQSVGVGSVRNRAIKMAGWIFAILIAGGFMPTPLYVFFTRGN